MEKREGSYWIINLKRKIERSKRVQAIINRYERSKKKEWWRERERMKEEWVIKTMNI